MPTVYGYIRVSTDSQVDSGLSLSDQTSVIASASKAIVVKHGVTLGRVFDDPGVSATRKDLRQRPSGIELDSILTAGDHVVIAKLDRAFRSQRDCLTTLESWERRGVIVHILDVNVDTSTPMGKLFIGILSAFAQWESARIGERIRDAKRSMRKAGLSVNGHRKLGYKVLRGKLVANDSERKLGKRIYLMRSRGMLWREIAERLNVSGVKRPVSHTAQKLRKWNAQSVSRLSAAYVNKWQN